MEKYELLYIIAAKYTDAEIESLMEKIKGMIASAGGTVSEMHNLGRRKLAYPISHVRNGNYVLVYFEAEPSTVAKLNEMLRLSTLEAVADEEDWHQLRDFIKQYGRPLFTSHFMILGNLRGILHRGVAKWLDSLRDPADEAPGRLLDDIDDGKLDAAQVRRWVELVLHTIEEHYEESGRGKDRNRWLVHDELCAEVQSFDTPHDFPAGRAMDLRFSPPPEGRESCLSSERPVYWELEVKLSLAGLDFEEWYLVPVYRSE